MSDWWLGLYEAACDRDARNVYGPEDEMDEETKQIWLSRYLGADLPDGGACTIVDMDGDAIVTLNHLEFAALAAHAPAVKALVDAAKKTLVSADARWEADGLGHDWPEAVTALRDALGPFTQGQDDEDAFHEFAAAEGAAQAEQEAAAWEAYQAEQDQAAAEQYAAYDEPQPDEEPPF